MVGGKPTASTFQCRLRPLKCVYMEKIIKVSPQLKNIVSKIAGVDWKTDACVVVFETDGVLLYLNEYGQSRKVSYEQIKNYRQND